MALNTSIVLLIVGLAAFATLLQGCGGAVTTTPAPAAPIAAMGECCTAVNAGLDYAKEHPTAPKDTTKAAEVVKETTALQEKQTKACADVKDKKTIGACPPAACCTAVNAAFDYAEEHTPAPNNTTKAAEVVKEITALQDKQTKACADVKDKKTIGACLPAASVIVSCKVKEGFQCDGISAGCCTANQAAVKNAAGADKKIKEAGGDATKINKITDESNALQEKVNTKCKADMSAMKKCAPTPPKTLMAEEPQQMMAGFCGFLAGAAVVGLAMGLKRRHSFQQPKLLG